MEITEGTAASGRIAPGGPAEDEEGEEGPADPASAPDNGAAAANEAPAPVRGAHFRPRRWPRRLLIGANIVVALALVASASAYGYIRWRVGQVNSVSLAHLAPVTREPGQPATSGGPAETILIVGSDSRAGQSAADAIHFGSASAVGGQRSDTIMLLRVDPATNQAHLLSIPRDLWVQIPGTHRKDRINSTFDTGPDLLVQAITQDLGIPINHYIEIDFQSFRGIVDAIHGVKIYFPTPAKDAFSGLNITTPGCYNLNGGMALAYVRARHYEYELNGRWYFEGQSDLARIRRQQDFVRKVMAKVFASGLTDPARLNGIVGAVVNSVTVDQALKSNQGDLIRAVKELKKLGANSLQTDTVPNYGTVIGGGDVLLLKQPDAFLALGNFLGTTPAMPHDQPGSTPTTGSSLVSLPGLGAGSVRVRVENGSGRTGQATQASRDLQRVGFVVTGAGSADNYRHQTSVVRYAPGDDITAQMLATAVGGGAQLQSDPSLSAGNLILVTGASYAGISTPTATTGSASPTTTSSTTTIPPIPGTPPNAPPC